MTEEATKLNPSIVVLKTGDKIITILQEVFEGEGDDRKGICLMMSYPYTLELLNVNNTDNQEQDLQVKYSKWCPYALDTQYRIPYDGVLTIGVPDPGLATAYLAKVESQQDRENRNAQLQQQEIEELLKHQKEEAINPEVV
jgi:hypothetical protein